MKLIPMTDFVLEIEKSSYTQTEKYRIIEWENKCQAFDKIINYTNFLKQPLKLEMFVPCDEKGKVIELLHDLNYMTSRWSYYGNDVIQYRKAKEKVLFEGFEIFKGTIYMCSVPMLKVKDLYQTTIEDLIYYEPILTENAVKQIEL